MAETEFSKLFEESVANKIYLGALLNGEVVAIDKEYVVINAGLKSESYIPTKQFIAEDGSVEVQVGDFVEVVVDALEDGLGETRLSREKAKKIKAWEEIVTLHEESKIVTGVVNSRVRGGFTVDIGLVKAFLPGSLVDVKPVKDNIELEGQELEFKIIKVDQKRNNIVVSRRSVLEQDNSEDRQALIDSLQEGQIVAGTVKNLVDYGAFIDLGGLDGLLHITDMAWKRVKHPSEVVSVGQDISVKVLKFDKDKPRVSLGLKQLESDPWYEVIKSYPVNSKLTGKVTNITDYGCFVEIEKGVEGLVYVSEIDWTNKNIHPSKVVQLGMEVEVMVIEIDEERRRISLGMKQCVDNPWSTFDKNYSKGDRVNGKIKSITDFGIFLGLDGGIDALIHLSDLSWDEAPDQAVQNYKKGQEVEAVVLSIDVERERISLGVKQLDQDAFMQYSDQNPKGSIVSGTVATVGDKDISINLATDIIGIVKTKDLEKTGVSLTEGEQAKFKVVNVDVKNKVINLTTKLEDTSGKHGYESDSGSSAKLGDILKEHLNNKDEG
jgi:small subunit ribosomal protein S1